MFKKILVPLDGSDIAEQALDTACDLAQRAGATLLLAHADTPYNAIYVEGLPVVDEEGKPVRGTHERVYLNRIKMRLEQQWMMPAPIEWRVLREKGATPACILSDFIAAEHVSLVVMTSHGRSGLERLWLGSVADQLIRLSHVPVLLVRPAAEGMPGSRLAKLERVLVPVDGSALAEEIAPIAQELGRLFGAELMLLYVSATPHAGGQDHDHPQLEPEEAKAYLDRTVEFLTRHGSPGEKVNALKVSTQMVTSDRTAAAILAAAQERPNTLIAMTTHGRSGLQRLTLGSVADKVLRGSEGPVLIYKPRGAP